MWENVTNYGSAKKNTEEKELEKASLLIVFI